MSHTIGTVPVLAVPLQIGPDSGQPPTAPNVWALAFTHAPAPSGTKFVILHFMNVSLPANNRLEVDLGYDTDVFTAADGGSFWTRPVNIAEVGGATTVPIRYITDGAANGSAHLDRYGRGENLQSHAAPHDSITNADPFLADGWTEPVFPHGPGTLVPKYDPFWICNKLAPPQWQNVRCASVESVQRRVARSVGMIITIHPPGGGHPDESVSSCSVTLIDADLVVLAGHCISNHPFEVPTSSVTFDYEVACDGSVLPAYNAVFYKVIRLVKYRYGDGRDYAILQLRGLPPVPAIPVRNAFPALNEQVFGVHHPNGAVKKTSPSAEGSKPVTSTGNMVGVNFDVAGGSSGSGLFDMAGRIVGVLANGSGCSLHYSSMRTLLEDPILVPDPPQQRAVMLVLDRSGSMSGSAGDGRIKINEAREAAELFTSMLRTSMGNQVGLVSFSSNASAPIEQALSVVTAASKAELIALLPAIVPGGRTSIGDGLAAARNQFPAPGDSPRSILLMTDGMENEPLAIDEVTGLQGIEITAIGFGTESNLDGPKLSALAQTHGGYYKRAGSGLELRKFFALAFGDIFEAGALADPQLHLPGAEVLGQVVPFEVCGEEAITVVVGWDTSQAALELELMTPSGQVVNLNTAPVTQDNGRTWLYARLPLPHAGERDGQWKTRVRRPGRGGEFPTYSRVPLTYFISVLARGGPSLRPLVQPVRLYTGDVLHPKVILQYADETVPQGGEVMLSLRRPSASVGRLLSQKGLGEAVSVNGDVIPARQATLQAMEASGPLITYLESSHVLTDAASGSESFEPAGIFGRRLEEVLVVEGTYSFHAKARVGMGCTLTREAQWAWHVAVGIDPDATEVTSEADGDRVRLTLKPADRYGNLVGPGAAGDMSVEALPGCTLVGELIDLKDGRYVQVLQCDPDSDTLPGVAIGQPERNPVWLTPPAHARTLYRYAVQLICGTQSDDCKACAALVPARYATAITLLNTTDKPAPVLQRIVPTLVSGAAAGRWPRSVGARGHERIVLEPQTATTLDCCSIHELLLGGAAGASQPVTLGMVVLESSARLQVSVLYSAASAKGRAPSIDVETLVPSETRIAMPRPEQPPAPTRPAAGRSVPPPRPQDIPKKKPRNPRPKDSPENREDSTRAD